MPEQKLLRQKEALKNLIEEMTKELPPMLMSIWVINRSTVMQLVDKLTVEQMDAIIAKARSVIDLIECAEGEPDAEP